MTTNQNNSCWRRIPRAARNPRECRWEELQPAEGFRVLRTGIRVSTRERLREAVLRRLMPEEQEVRDRTPARQTPEVEEVQDRTLQEEVHPGDRLLMPPAGVAVRVGEVQPVPVALPVHTVPAAAAPSNPLYRPGFYEKVIPA
jgi:hypothetical protein